MADPSPDTCPTCGSDDPECRRIVDVHKGLSGYIGGCQDEWHARPAAGSSSPDQADEIDRLRATDELPALQAWKAEAMTVLAEWEEVWEELGRPGPLGTSKAAACLAEIRRRA